MSVASTSLLVLALYLASILLAVCLKWSEYIPRLSRLAALPVYSKNMPVRQHGKKIYKRDQSECILFVIVSRRKRDTTNCLLVINAQEKISMKK